MPPSGTLGSTSVEDMFTSADSSAMSWSEQKSIKDKLLSHKLHILNDL